MNKYSSFGSRAGRFSFDQGYDFRSGSKDGPDRFTSHVSEWDEEIIKKHGFPHRVRKLLGEIEITPLTGVYCTEKKEWYELGDSVYVEGGTKISIITGFFTERKTGKDFVLLNGSITPGIIKVFHLTKVIVL